METKNIEIKVLTPVDTDGLPCSAKSPDYSKTVLMDAEAYCGAGELMPFNDGVNISSIQMVRPGQDDCMGRMRFWVEEYLCFLYDFAGIWIGDTVFLKREDIKGAGSESFREPEPTIEDFNALPEETQHALWEEFNERNLQGTADDMPFYQVLMNDFLVGYVGH